MKTHLALLTAIVCSMSMFAATISVTPGDGTLKTAINNAASGDVLELSTGTYGVSSNIDIATENLVLTLQAAAGAQPVINITEGSIRLKATGVKFTLDGLSIEGTSSIRGLVIGSGIENTSLTVNNCIFKHLQRAIYVEDARLTCKDVHITNSSFLHVGDGSNRTIYFAPVSGEDDIQYDVTCEIDHCTFYDCNNTRTVYCPAYNGSHVTNCVAYNTVQTDGYNAYAVYGKKSYVHNSLAFKTGIKTSSNATQSKCIFQDPLFVDAENDNLQLYKNSPAVGAGTDGSTIGDPRWGVSDEEYDISCTPIAERIYKNPYSMAPTTSSVKILWQQSDSLSLGRVAYGTDSVHLNDTVTSRGGWMVAGEGYVHIVQLTGLKPFTRYYFKVGDKKSFYDYVASTKTAPEAGVAYRIFTISDIHDNSCKNWENMQDDVLALKADLMMCNGDFCSNGAGRDWNNALFTPGKRVLATLPLMSATGNHETGDPLTYRWSTMFDYFSQFSHGTPDDSIRDPRGEGYFGYDYGNARILAVSVSGEPSSPLFSKTSNQYKWLESELKNATQDWILIFGHVGLTTSGYHGQWPPEYRDAWRSLFEQYAKQGKKIIYFCGDDHSFEHAYKDGVHYVRPGCGRNANYAQCKTKDIQYSMYYNQISCYSTLDMAADGSSIHLTAHDSASNVFYEYEFLKNGEEIVPSIQFTSPTKVVEVVDSVNLKWFLFDPNKDAKVSLYYSTTPGLQSIEGLTQIAQNLSSSTTQFTWHTRTLEPKGDYYIYATLTSGGKTYFSAKNHPIRLMPDTIAPPAPTNFTAWVKDNHFQLIWENPTHLVDLGRDLNYFTTDIDGMEARNDDNSSVTLTHHDGALKVDYTVSNWEETSADYVFTSATDCRQTPHLHFRLLGNGSSTAIRFVCKNLSSDNEDWWYTESIKLKSTTWQNIVLDLRSLSALSWHTNTSPTNQCEGLLRLCFGVSTDALTTGTFFIDDLYLTGQIYPAPDYSKTIIRRSTIDYPATINDGDAVYEGTAETYLDTESSTEQLYYYSAFALDDQGNASEPTHWLSTNVLDGIQDVHTTAPQPLKWIQGDQLRIQNGSTTYSAQGQMLE